MAHGYKTGGRSAGTPNKKTSIGKLVEKLLEKELTNINNYLNNLNNKERIEVILKLLPFATPKLTRQEKHGVEGEGQNWRNVPARNGKEVGRHARGEGGK